MQKKAKPCTLSIFNLGSSPVSALPSFFPSKGKKDAQLLKPLERRHTLALQSNAEGSQGLQNTQNPTELSAISGYQLFSCGFSPSLTGFSPQHASIHSHSLGRKASGWKFLRVPPGEAIKWLLRLSSPARNIKAGFAHWSLQKGRMKTQVHICTFMSCHQRRPFLKNPTFVQLNSGRVARRGNLDNPKD